MSVYGEVSSSEDLALKSIRHSEATGAAVSDLVKKYNGALDLLHQADLGTCSQSDCVVRANEIFKSIIDESVSLSQRSHEVSSHKRIMSFAVFAPVIAFSVSFVGIYSYYATKSNQMRKFLDLEIREKQD